MRTITATEASRSFAALLDDAEKGETTIVTRAGRRIAVIGPAGTGNGSALAEFLGKVTPDATFADDIDAVRESARSGPVAWPAD